MRDRFQVTSGLCMVFALVTCTVLLFTGCSRFSLSADKPVDQTPTAIDQTADAVKDQAEASKDDDLNAKIQAHADELLAAIERQQAQQKAQQQSHSTSRAKPVHDRQVDQLAAALDRRQPVAVAKRNADVEVDPQPLPTVQWLDLTPAPKPIEQVVQAKPEPAPTTQQPVATPQVPIVAVASTPDPSVAPQDTAALTEQLADNVRSSDQSPLQKALALSSLSLSCNKNLLVPEDLRELNSMQLLQVRKMHTLVLQTLARQETNEKPSGDQQSAMNDQITNLFGPAATRIGQIELCRNVSGYGVYDPFESNTFLAGIEQPLILYVELENFNSLYDGQQYRVRLSQEVALYTDADGLRVWHLPREEIVDVSRKKRRDFFTVQLLQLPARLGVGKYRLKVRIHDINARSFDEMTVPINLVASQNTTAKNEDTKPSNLRSN